MTSSVIQIDGALLQSGVVRVGGFKHAFVSVMSACIATRGTVLLSNVPDILETEIMCSLVHQLGGTVCSRGNALQIECETISRTEVSPVLSREIHGSIYLIPALMAACKEVRFRESGGCRIGSGTSGARPVEHMIRILQAFGAQFEERRGWLCGYAKRWEHASFNIMHFSNSRDLLTGPLVSGATKTAILGSLGVCEAGHSTVLHPYTKPDVTQMLAFIRAQGASVIDEANGFHLSSRRRTGDCSNTTFTLISDLSEIITFVTLAVVMHVPLRIEGVTAEHARHGLATEIELLERMGIALAWTEDSLLVSPPKKLRSVDIEVTSVGIYSDHQPFFALMLLCGDRPAFIRERVWTNRFTYAKELRKLGAQIEIGDGEILVCPSRLLPFDGTLEATDLRAAAALVIAACMTKTPVKIAGLNHLQRGYASLLSTLSTLGVRSFHI
ncbi:hypothetical protein [Pseudomonas sp. EA_65y_Pfl2_P74]|uniref:hypothetical protein n=1 Tax=Pseudomonas sp. EA_65y_Pfl2_P74 TaxID=3088694 RepID=UPI0030DB3D2F